MGDMLGALAVLRAGRFVDLTHAFHPAIPHCPSFAPERRTTLYDHRPGPGTMGDGFLAHEYCLPGQWGTHVDPPAHFAEGGATLDELPVCQMLAPLVVLDIAARAALDPDTVATCADLGQWEAAYGPVPQAAFVALNTGWHHRWPDAGAMANRDAEGRQRFPGWSMDLLTVLVEHRDVVAIGHDTTDTDPGLVVSARGAPLEDYWLRAGKWQIELLANLDDVPASGAIIVATWPKPLGGSGFPARCFAIV